MGVASQEDKSATSIERHTMKRMTCIDESEADVEQTVMGTALIMTPWCVFLSMPRHG
jgi:hypothetical protein